MRNFVVTFARGFGTGGKLIASKLAAELGIHCYENRILTLASQLSGLDRDVFAEVDEKLRSSKGGFASLMKGLPRAKKYIAHNERFVSDDALFEYQKQIILNLADTESCVIVGKCADYILQGRDNVVSVYIEAPRDYCIKRTMENMGVTEEVAQATIKQTDKFRADYYEYYTHGNYWTNPINYDMTLNSEKVGMLESGKAYVKITHEDKGHNIPDDIKTYSESKVKNIPDSAKTHSEDKVKIVPPTSKTHPAEKPAHIPAPEKEAVTTDDDPAAGGVSLDTEAPKIVPPVAKRECKKYS